MHAFDGREFHADNKNVHGCLQSIQFSKSRSNTDIAVFRVEPVLAPSAAPAAVAIPTDPAASGDWPTLADVERIHLEKTLAATLQNKSLAAKILGIDRSVLRRKLQRYGLDDGT